MQTHQQNENAQMQGGGGGLRGGPGHECNEWVLRMMAHAMSASYGGFAKGPRLFHVTELVLSAVFRQLVEHEHTRSLVLWHVLIPAEYSINSRTKKISFHGYHRSSSRSSSIIHHYNHYYPSIIKFIKFINRHIHHTAQTDLFDGVVP